jgi:hypothetical protein
MLLRWRSSRTDQTGGKRFGRGVTTSIGVVTVAAVASMAVPASAAPLDRHRFENTTSRTIDGFCGDLTVRFDQDVHGNVLLLARGVDGVVYWMETIHGSSSFTNLANGKTFTQVFNYVEKDLTITDNGDGTRTILVLATGAGNKTYGSDGGLVFHDPGQIRYEILVSDSGTPDDVGDDEAEFLGIVKGSTGRNDLDGQDFCQYAHQLIG